MLPLDKQRNGSRPEQQDLLHATARYSNVSQVASTKDKRSPQATALQPPSHIANEDSLRNGENCCLAATGSGLIYPSILIADLAGQKDGPPAPIYERDNTNTSLSGRTRKKKHDPFKHRLLAQFGFQPFKKCFYVKCSTIFVPADFKPSSPRRMFCSTNCFEAHWREKLFRYLEKTLVQVVDNSKTNLAATAPAVKSVAA
jgi:hypothetical protein